MNEDLIYCDDRCLFAKNNDCDCTICNGLSHRKGWEIADLPPAIRTAAGRRVPLLRAGTREFQDAEKVYKMTQDGFTRREVAEIYFVSISTIRRMIRSYLASIETKKTESVVAIRVSAAN